MVSHPRQVVSLVLDLHILVLERMWTAWYLLALLVGL